MNTLKFLKHCEIAKKKNKIGTIFAAFSFISITCMYDVSTAKLQILN